MTDLFAPNFPGKFVRWMGPWRMTSSRRQWFRTARCVMPDGHECNQLVWGPKV